MKKILSAICIAMAALTSSAQGFDNLPDPIEDVNKVVDNTPDSIAKALMSRPKPGTTRKGSQPVLFLIGNSTMRNGTLGNGNNGQWGWGYFAHNFFDAGKIAVENQALGGMSTRTFYKQLWPAVREALKPGDWVIVSIGHNDNGPFFSGRARAVIPGIADTMIVGKIEGTDIIDTVYSYGGYMRKYIEEIRAKGAHPILMSLTPRNAYDDNDKIVRKPHGEWLKAIANEQNVPYVDLNEISGQKLDRYGHWKESYHFYKDNIHTSKFGAEMNARSAAEGIMANGDSQLDELKAMMINVAPDVWHVDRSSGKPVVFFTGDSTVKNADNDDNGMWGWASQAQTVFDESKITLCNAARAGRSTRTFLKEGLWDKVYNSLQPGDYVTIQFGHNDICPIDDQKARGVIPGTADTNHVYRLADKNYEVVYSFGWYLKKFIQDVREKGATPILVSLTPRNEWPGGRIERRDDTYGKWYREVVEETGVEFIDMHNISADFLDKKFSKKVPANKEKAKAAVAKIKEKAGVYFKKDHTHASKLGAQMNARSFAKGLRDTNSRLAQYLK